MKRTAAACAVVVSVLVAYQLSRPARAQSAPHVEASYVNTFTWTVPANGDVYIMVPVPARTDRLVGWVIGLDVDGDPPNFRNNCWLEVAPPGTTQPDPQRLIGDYLYRSGRQLRGAPNWLAAPYIVEQDEALFLTMKATNLNAYSVTTRCNIAAYFLED